MSSFGCCKINIRLGAVNTFVETDVLKQLLEVVEVGVNDVGIDLVQFGALSRTGDSEEVIDIILLLAGYFGVFVGRILSDRLQQLRHFGIVCKELLAVFLGIGFVKRVAHFCQLGEDRDLRLGTHAIHRLFEPRIGFLFGFILGEVLAVLYTFLTQDICLRITRIVAEILDTLVAEFQCEIAEAVLLSRIGSLVVHVLNDIQTFGVNDLVGIRTGGVHRPPRIIGILVLFVLDTLVEEGDVHQALFGDDGFFFHYSRRLFGRSFYFGFLCASECRNSCTERDNQ